MKFKRPIIGKEQILTTFIEEGWTTNCNKYYRELYVSVSKSTQFEKSQNKLLKRR